MIGIRFALMNHKVNVEVACLYCMHDIRRKKMSFSDLLLGLALAATR